jgi:hypothetical protein
MGSPLGLEPSGIPIDMIEVMDFALDLVYYTFHTSPARMHL